MKTINVESGMIAVMAAILVAPDPDTIITKANAVSHSIDIVRDARKACGECPSCGEREEAGHSTGCPEAKK